MFEGDDVDVAIAWPRHNQNPTALDGFKSCVEGMDDHLARPVVGFRKIWQSHNVHITVETTIAVNDGLSGRFEE